MGDNLERFGRIFFNDPGIILAIGNVLLFSRVNALSFFVIAIALFAIVFSKLMLIMDSNFVKGIQAHSATKYLKRKYIGLELMGYACLLVAILSIIEGSAHGVVCGLCFGFANLILASKFENFHDDECGQICNFIKKGDSPTKIIFAIIKEPIVLISVGMITSGLSAGGQSVITLPLMISAPALVLIKPSTNRAIPQALFGISSIWYVIVGVCNGEILASLANLCFSTAFFIVAFNENDLFKSQKFSR